MIILKNVNKYFNKKKLHVINNISLTLKDTGVVALLGSSGSGKTTLLNAIGGLDKINNGSIYIDDKKISSRFSYKVDKIRNLNVGYIFQDYKLIENLSVYDNVAIVLAMIGIKDKNEIKKRVEYVLDKVGMLRYKKRYVSMLSGGERQRVGIARAIVKETNIILADEPTGNLDSKNSLEIMKIIKAISKDRLVILVTHEESLAKFYADRIIEIQDGVIIKDYKNKDLSSLDYELDNNFYLKDFKYNKSIKEDKIDLDVYTNDVSKIKLDIVFKNGNIYIKSNTSNKIEVVDDNSNIEFIDDHYKKIDKKDIDKLEFDFKNVINNNFKKKYSSILNPFTMIVEGFKRLFDYSLLKKILLGGFFLSGIFVMYSISSISSTFKINDEDFVSLNRNYLKVENLSNDVLEYLEYEKMPFINYIIPGDSLVYFNLIVDDYYQTIEAITQLNASLAGISMLNSENLIMGRMPINKDEVVIDKMTVERAMSDNDILKMAGFSSYVDILNKKLEASNLNSFTVVGVVDLKSPSVYVDDGQLINIISNCSFNYDDSYNYYNIFDYDVVSSLVSLKEGRAPKLDYEIIVNISNKEFMPLYKTIDTKINNNKLKVVGYYDSLYDYDYYLTNSNTIKYKTIMDFRGYSIYSHDKDEVIAVFKDMGLNIKDSYVYSKNKYIESVRELNSGRIIVSFIMLLISVIEMYLMIRASFLSRIKEIGILRAIGVKKIDIYKMFYGEIFAITTLSSLFGVLFMAYAFTLIDDIPYLKDTFLINPFIVILAIVFVYLFNLLVGLIPVFNVIRKTPASILARGDLD